MAFHLALKGLAIYKQLDEYFSSVGMKAAWTIHRMGKKKGQSVEGGSSFVPSRDLRHSINTL